MKTTHNAARPHIVGDLARLGSKPHVNAWTPLSRQQAEALPALPPPPPRGWPLPAQAVKDAAPATQAPGRPPLALPADLPPDSLQARVAARLPETAGLLRTLILLEDEADAVQKAAVVCLELGEDLAGEVMRHLKPLEVETLTRAIANTLKVSAEYRDQAVAEFEEHLAKGDWITRDGVDFCRSALLRAVGPHQAQEILDRVAAGAGAGFYLLRNATPEQVTPFISHEHPQTVALILSQLDPDKAAGILALLPEALQADVVHRITTMDNVPQGVLKQVGESLEWSLRNVLGGDQNVGGPRVAANILNFSGSSVERNVLNALDQKDPEQAESVRNLMFVFADIARCTDKDVQAILREVDPQDLAVALKAADESTMAKILNNFSTEKRAEITQQIEETGPMRLTDVEAVQLRIVQLVRRLEEQGKVTIVRGITDEAFV